MPKEKKKLAVKEIKEISPLADVYELSSYRKYIIVIRKPSIIGMDQSHALMVAKEVARICILHKIPIQLLVNVDFDEVKFLEIS
jgi:hypothetical protein